MVIKTKVKSKHSYLFPENKDTGVTSNKATKNTHRQMHAKMKGEKDFKRTKEQDSMVVSWFSPKKYKGFKIKTK